MSIIKNLFGGRRERPSFPERIEVIPDRLTCRVTLSSTPGKSTWLFMSEGLRSFGQQEVLIGILEDEARERHANLIPKFFAQLASLAGSGRVVGPGDFTELGPTGFINESIRGLLYATTRCAVDPSVPPDVLVATLVTYDEVQLAKVAGVHRVLSRLGKRFSCYPFPLFSSFNRPEVVFPGDAESLVANVTSTTCSAAHVLVDDNTIRLQVLRGQGDALSYLIKSAPTGQVFALRLNPSSKANASLVWEPGQTAPSAISRPDIQTANTAAGFLMLGAGVEDAVIDVVEDGASFLCSEADFAAMVRAIGDEQPWQLDRPGGRGFLLEWIETQYQNPLTGEVHEASGGWQTYTPDNAAAAAPREQVVLLTDESALGAAVETTALATFIKALSEAARSHLEESSQTEKLVIEVSLDVELAPSIRGMFIPARPVPDELVNAVLAVEAPAVRGPLSFQWVLHRGGDE